MPDREQYVVGVDYGTLSGRAVVVRVSDGAELGTGVHDYPHAVLDTRLPGSGPTGCRRSGRCRCPRTTARCCAAPCRPRSPPPASTRPTSIGIATDFTACTMVPTLADGTPLCEVEEYADRPHAYVKLWKHHAAQGQADRINRLAAERGEAWLPRYGGLISSEWEFAKGLQLFEEDRELYDRMERWVEAADWIVWQLCGSYVRNACTAGYKGSSSPRRPGRPLPVGSTTSRRSRPGFGGFVADKLDHQIGQLGDRAGTLTAEAAAWTGLPEGIAVAVGNVDAHVTAPAAQAVEPGQMVAIMGTSTCHVMSADVLREVPGMCGVVDGGIVAGQLGLRGRAERRRRHLRLVHRDRPSPRRTPTRRRPPGESLHEHLTRLAAAAGGRRARPGRPRLAQRQPLGARRPRALRPGASGRPWRPGPRTSTARCSRPPPSAPG